MTDEPDRSAWRLAAVELPDALALARWTVVSADVLRSGSSGAIVRDALFDGELRVEGGLYCPIVFGGPAAAPRRAEDVPSGQRYGHVDLPFPMRHPIVPMAEIDAVVVIPPRYRPACVGEDGQPVQDPLNALYAQLVRWCRRYRDLDERRREELRADIELVVERLFVNSRRHALHQGAKPVPSLCDRIERARDRAAVRTLLLGLGVEATVAARQAPEPGLRLRVAGAFPAVHSLHGMLHEVGKVKRARLEALGLDWDEASGWWAFDAYSDDLVLRIGLKPGPEGSVAVLIAVEGSPAALFAELALAHGLPMPADQTPRWPFASASGLLRDTGLAPAGTVDVPLASGTLALSHDLLERRISLRLEGPGALAGLVQLFEPADDDEDPEEE